MKNLNDLISDIRKKSADMKQLEGNMLKIIGVESVKIIKNNFDRQGYEFALSWPARKKVTNHAYDYARTKNYRTPVRKQAYKPRNPDKPYQNPYKGSVVSSKNKILVQTGNLRDSITYKATGKVVSIGVFPNFMKHGAKKSSHVYAKKMNEGGAGTWGKNKTFTVARQFMPKPGQPPTKKMEQTYIKSYESELQRIMGDWKK